jgi:hypothetical protein
MGTIQEWEEVKRSAETAIKHASFTLEVNTELLKIADERIKEIPKDDNIY